MDFMRILRHPRAAVVAHDLVMVIVSWLAAGWIIHRGDFLGVISTIPIVTELFLITLVQGLVLWSTGLYKGLWRFASFPD
ncbi:MAG: polysaccharide biosynthesis protein, partial [Gammaproteobacteria bacterium]|nr:polysaccharide biosynthesis protein [Gammaproteobacteria bacterium]